MVTLDLVLTLEVEQEKVMFIVGAVIVYTVVLTTISRSRSGSSIINNRKSSNSTSAIVNYRPALGVDECCMKFDGCALGLAQSCIGICMVYLIGYFLETIQCILKNTRKPQ